MTDQHGRECSNGSAETSNTVLLTKKVLPPAAKVTIMSKETEKKIPVNAATPCSALAARIPFRMLMHTSGDKAHSGRYTNEKLGIGHEYHHPAKDGYVKTGPKVKVKKWFYRESPKDAPCYPTLRELLDADQELRERAEAAYPLNAEVSDRPS
jgi:hypothetical protein